MYQPIPEFYDISQEIKIEGLVNKFKYQGSEVANSNRLDIEPGTWISNASKAFSGLRERVWLNKDLPI